MTPFSVLIVEDQARFRDAFTHALGSVPDIELLGIAPDLPQGRRMFDQLQPDVLLVDLDLPGGSGIELIRHAAQTRPQCEVMVISVFGDEQHVVASIEAGATGYLLKDSLALDLPGQLRSLRAGGSPISPVIARRLLVRLAPGAQGSSGPSPEAMGSFSIWHWLIVLVVVIAIFGTKKLRNVGSDLGAAVKGFKDGMKDGSTAEEPHTPQQKVTASKVNDPNTVDVDAKTKS